LLTRERLGRYWLLAAATDRLTVRTLAERLVGELRPVASRRGVQLPFAVGIALCPEDGRDATALAARADIALCDARATGRTIALVNTSIEDLDLSG
jgi:predicted signal transduction protein with EAL and GGDEF domain